MVGRELTNLFPKVATTTGDIVLDVRGAATDRACSGRLLHRAEREIVALAGLVGSGRSEVVQAVFGVDRYDAGRVLLHGKPLKPGNAREAVSRGVALVPEDRRQQGLFMPASIARNSAIVILKTLHASAW